LFSKHDTIDVPECIEPMIALYKPSVNTNIAIAILKELFNERVQYQYLSIKYLMFDGCILAIHVII